MDFGELLEAAKNNPEIKAMLSKFLGRTVEGEPFAPGAQELAKQTTDESLRNTRSNNLQEILGNLVPGKSAQESADILKNAPEFTLQGDPYGPQQPNFRLQGNSYTGNVPATIPKISGVPAIRNAAGIPATLERDVTPELNSSFENAPTSSLLTPDKMSTGEKLILGGGGLAAAGLGGAALLDGSGNGNNDNTNAPPGPIPTAPQPPEVKNLASEGDNNSSPDDDKRSPNNSEQKEKSSSNSDDNNNSADDNSNKEEEPTKEQPPFLDFGSKEHNQSTLSNLLKQQQSDVHNQQQQRALALMAAGIARVTPNLGMYDQAIKESGLPVDQYLLQKKMENEDPSSGTSMGMRSYLKKLGVNVSDGATAAQIGQVLPFLFKDIEAKQAQAAKSADVQYRADALKQQRDLAMLQHKDNQALLQQGKHDKMSQDQSNKMDQQAEQLRGNPAIQQDMRTIQRVQNAMSIIKQYSDPNQIPPQILNILNTDLATIASGGVPGEGLIHEVATPTIMSKIANGAQQFLNRPTGANAAAFVKQNENIFNTLSSDATNRLQERYRRIGNTLGRNVRNEDKEAYRRTYLPNDTYDSKTGDFTSPQSASGEIPAGNVGISLPSDAQSKAQDEIQRRLKMRQGQ